MGEDAGKSPNLGVRTKYRTLDSSTVIVQTRDSACGSRRRDRAAETPL